MLNIKNLTVVDNELLDGELSKLNGVAVLKLKTGASTSTNITGQFQMNSCGVGTTASIKAAVAGVESIKLSTPANMTVELTSHITRTFLVEAGSTSVDTKMKGLVSATQNGEEFGTAVSNGVITISSAATTSMIELDLEVLIATGVAESDAGHQLLITADNEAGFMYFNILAPVVNCVGRNKCHFNVRGVKPSNSLNDHHIIEIDPSLASVSGSGYATVTAVS